MTTRIVLLLSIASSACRAEPSATTVAPFDSVFSSQVFVVEEDERDLVVAPQIRVESTGYLYTDFTEARVRKYDSDGRLQWAAGGKGDGPGEYTMPSDIGRLPDGRILVFEYNGRTTVLSSDGQQVLDIRPRRFRNVEKVEIISESLLLIAAELMDESPVSPGRSKLHVWDWNEDTILRSFFTPFESTPHTDAIKMASWVRADLRGDTIAAIHPVADSVFLLRLDGSRIDALPLRIEGYVAPRPAPEEVATDMALRRDWVSTFDLVSDVEWLGNGDLLVAYRRQWADSIVWNTVLVSRTPAPSIQMLKTGQLVNVGPGDEVLFIDPRSEVPNQWLIARRR